MSISAVSGLQAATIIVSSTAGQGNYTTLAAALTAASSGATILVKPGTYTENLTLKAGVNITAFDCDALTPNVIISGKCTFTGAGTVSLSGICLQTNSDYALAITGSAASIVNLTNCFINCLNNTAIQYSSSSSSSSLNLYSCNGNIATTGISLFAYTSAGTFNAISCFFQNSGVSVTASSMAGTGICFFNYCVFNNCFSSSSGHSYFFRSYIYSGAASCITSTGTATPLFSFCTLGSSTAVIAACGSANATSLLNSECNTTNTDIATGAGVLQYWNVLNTGSSSVFSTVSTTNAFYPLYSTPVTSITSLTGPQITFGSGVPGGSAAQGSLYLRTDGTTTNDRAYINTNGTTGWTAITTAS